MLSWRHSVGSSAMTLEELVTQGKKRHAALKGMLKPFGAVSSLCSAGLWIYRFYKNSGEFTFTLLGLAALTFFLLYYATAFSGIKLLARRALALFIGIPLFRSLRLAIQRHTRQALSQINSHGGGGKQGNF